jgi:hypothetical protein
MSAKEFLFKTCLFILLPGLLIYGCLRENEVNSIDRVAYQACIQSLHNPTVTEMIVVGQADDGRLVHKCTAEPTTLRKLRLLAKGLHAVRVQPGVYRPSLRHYRLVLSNGRDTCELAVYKMPLGKADLLDGVADSAYEAPQFIPFLDSLFRSLPPNKDEGNSKVGQWLNR